ncbi:hypothetical protein RYX36_019302 [Vicia faba]
MEDSNINKQLHRKDPYDLFGEFSRISISQQELLHRTPMVGATSPNYHHRDSPSEFIPLSSTPILILSPPHTNQHVFHSPPEASLLPSSDIHVPHSHMDETLRTWPLDASPLPFELVVEILCRLPPKLLVQFRCLCKSFKTLISDPKFIQKHLRLSKKRSCHRLLLNPGRESHVLSYPLHSGITTFTNTNNATRLHYPFKQFYYIFGSCDGILFLEANNGSLVLWNPSIQKFKTLPSLGLGLCQYRAYGFGFDTLIDNYKVVSVLCEMDNEGFLKATAKIKVHTLGTDSWRMIPGDFPAPLTRWLKLASGTLNWFASDFAYDDYTIISFYLVNESYRNILPPKHGGELLFEVSLDVLRDCLCIFSHSCTFSRVWIMKEYGNEESWTQLFRIPCSPESFYTISATPIWISKDDQVLMKKEMLPAGDMNLAICDFKNGACKILMKEYINHWGPSDVYIESLVSPCF